MKRVSIINGQPIPKGEVWEWDVRKASLVCWESSHGDHCSRCGEEVCEQFQTPSVISHGVLTTCRDCCQQVASVQWSGSSYDLCPICGFGSACWGGEVRKSDGKTRVICIFGHRWYK